MKDQKTSLDYKSIARRAYELYVARGKEEGHALQDWIHAEAELRAAAEKPVKPKTTTTTHQTSTNRGRRFTKTSPSRHV
jgi:hypothetical protein